MNRRRYKAERKSYAGKLIIALIVVSVIAVSSFVTVMANTVPCTVVDGDKSYSFSLISPDVNGIVQKAVSEGMEPLGADDRIQGGKGELVIDRALAVSLEIDGSFTNLVGYKGERLDAVLERGGAVYSVKDRLEPAADTVLTADTAVSIDYYTPAVVWVDGEGRRAELYGGTVADALTALDITLKDGDKITPAKDAKLTPELFVKIETQKKITVADGGVSKEHAVYGVSVEAALKELGITAEETDKVSPAPETKLTDGMAVTVDRVTFKETKETETIAYGTSYIDDSSMDSGSTAVDTLGVAGSKEITYKETYVNGTLSHREVLNEKVLSEPVDEVILQGTKESAPSAPAGGGISSGSGSNTGGSTFIDYNGNEVSYSNSMSGSSTAYTAPAGAITSLGWTAAVGIVAVNPNVIPYGTKLYIASDDYVYGYAVAGDTGGALMAGDALVDVYYPTYDECVNFGRRNMTVYILS